ncbi:MAG: transcriptional repressor [Chlamydiae bacterium]|nr:transcriptional repressor [Chlamydiota bacterium]MBI3276304.1 transcriptional repressor [Chlamydiota bacterium]
MKTKALSVNRFKSFLQERSLKLTHERRCIFEKVSRLKGHFNADSLYESLKEEKARIARGTVYRTLPLLLESGVIQKSVGEGKREFFESQAGRKHHDHLICLRCHKVIEFHSDEIENLQDTICARYAFEMVFHDHRMYGHCEDCQLKKG